MTDCLQLWIDEMPRDGPSNMAVDEWLLKTAEVPVLRSYLWQEGWGSFGYFVSHEEAASELPDRQLVRRWTGGGIVDHAGDWTYTLLVPGRQWLACEKGDESYRVIHSALAKALKQAGMAEARLAGPSHPSRGGPCFVQAVEHDLVGNQGVKIAGAGQRRNRNGLLHQGSVATSCRPAAELASMLAAEVERRQFELPDLSAEAGRYASEAWYQRR